ncbi:efflux RND transporter periplasmic adaptor subunit [Flavobacterium sp. F372]|uniref:Efflux RND transporter periplasmic adaptor subunit n=1 Tax=Flavobacterium bernardetii TaxID=2813823 RepID=A0ABR7IWK8_9FLAO|nr:efflux RND transporter periplasmic adaptor subunit [Flavobacterium bernardetii]MBC5834166.1 efflux RND transporter periplasmic adaptor subunit [Flavobacterium bernardetii]NHF69398.1 efflux RND transporter periplasmic adaptor subunit [Flavobacterium bernardetii]
MKNIYLVLILALTIACQSKKEETATETAVKENVVELTKNQLDNSKIKIGNLTNTSLSSTIKVNGKITLAPNAMASVSMPLGGYIKTIKVMPGMVIGKGQILAVIEDQSYVQIQQDYLTTKQQLAYASKDFARQKELNSSQAVSEKNFQLAESEFAKQRITLKSLEEKLKLIHINPTSLTANTISKSVNIYAPISGMITKIDVNIGKYVNATDMLFQIMDNQSMYAKLNVFEKDAANLAIGQKIKVYTNTQPDVFYETKIEFVNKSYSDENAIEVYAKISNTTKKLIPGNYINASIQIDNNNAFVLSNDAIIDFEDKKFVFVQDANKNSFSMQEVQIGIVTDKVSEIRNYETLQNKNVVISDAYTLLMVLKNKEE